VNYFPQVNGEKMRLITHTCSYIKTTFKKKFVRNIVLVSSATAFAQVLNMITSPIVTRIYSPYEYGIFTVFSSIIALLAIVGSLKYELVIPIVEEEDAILGVVLSLIVLLVYVVIILVILKLWGNQIFTIIGAEELIKFGYLIPIGILFIQTYAILIQYSYRQKNFKVISNTMTIQSLIGNAGKILAGISGFGVIGLLISKILSESSGLFTLSKPLIGRKKVSNKITFQKLRWLASRYKKFPLYQFPSTLMAQISLYLPVFFLGSMYDSKVVGSFGLAYTIVKLPMNLIGKSVSNVFYAEASSLGKSNALAIKMLSDNLFKKMIILGFIPLVILLLFSPYLFAFVFGDSWIQAGKFARILSFMVFANFIFTPVSRVFEILEKQAEVLLSNIFRLMLTILTFFLSIQFGFTVFYTILIYTIAMSLTYLITYLMAQHYIKKAITH
jgi:O-antigen/teichoic acid export membrane protein